MTHDNRHPATAALLLIAALLLAPARVLADNQPPELTYNRDNEFSIVDMNTEPRIVFRVDYKDASGIDPASVRVFINGEDVTGLARITADHVEVIYMQPEGGLYNARVEAADKAGNGALIEWNVMYQAC